VRAILLSAGLGTRLRPLTNTIPKCLVPIKGQPLLGVWLERLSKAGMGPFLVNTHYLAGQVESFVRTSSFHEQVRLVNELELLGTAGTLIENLDFFQGGDGMLIHADNYCLADLSAFEQAHLHRPPECVMTMMTFRTDSPSTCGIVELNEQHVVVGFYEKVLNPPDNLANGAVYILSAEFLEIMRNQLHFVKDFSTEVLHRLIGRIYTYESKEIFIDIGDAKAFEKVSTIV
jgi:mannose-1-phosphate guanylyltransferase